MPLGQQIYHTSDLIDGATSSASTAHLMLETKTKKSITLESNYGCQPLKFVIGVKIHNIDGEIKTTSNTMSATINSEVVEPSFANKIYKDLVHQLQTLDGVTAAVNYHSQIDELKQLFNNIPLGAEHLFVPALTTNEINFIEAAARNIATALDNIDIINRDTAILAPMYTKLVFMLYSCHDALETNKVPTYLALLFAPIFNNLL